MAIAAAAGGADNPFAAFLAARPRSPGRKSPLDAPVPLRGVAPTPLDGLHDGRLHDGPTTCPMFPGMDAFATFMVRRPPHPTKEADELRCEILRAKKQLLQASLDAELQLQAGGSDADDRVARLGRLALAQRYLDHPERALDTISLSSACSSSRRLESRAASEIDGSSPPPAPSADVSGAVAAPPRPPSCSSRSGANDVTPHGSQAAAGGSSGSSSGAGTLARVNSKASLLRNSGALTSAASAAGSLAWLADREPVLDRWSRRVRPFNIILSSNDPLSVSRRSPTMPGGTMAVGSGPMPYYAGRHLLNEGYYCSFRVCETDDERRPGASALALGVSRVPPDDPCFEGSRCPVHAYEVPGVVMLGYGAKYVEERRWHTTSWDSSAVRLNDKVGMMLTSEGELVVFINDKQVARVPTNLGTSSRETQQKHYPIVDLGGHVSGLTLLPLRPPPNVPLRARSRVERVLV